MAASKKKNCFLKERFWRLAARGKKRALIAIAHTILVLVYRSLTSGQQYQERGSAEVDETTRRRLGRLGIAVSSLRLAGPDDPNSGITESIG